MADMKLTDEERKEEGDTMVSRSHEAPEYPYGLTVHLDELSMKKLGTDLKEVGSECVFSATSKVTSVSQSEDEDSGSRQSMTLQITDMEIKSADETSPEEALYGKKE